MSHRARIRIFDVPVDLLDLDAVLDRIDRFIATGGTHHIVTVNPEFIMTARRNAAFKAVLQRADLAVADGAGLMLAAHLTGQPQPPRITGVALCDQIVAHSAQAGWRIFLLGAAPGIAERAAEAWRARYPACQIVGCYSGSPHPADDAAITARLAEAAPDVLLVAFGSPGQDLWIARRQPELGIPVAIGVGGTFDFVSGHVQRAPAWMQRTGTEWLYRLVQQPWRIQRIITAVVHFPLAVVREQIRRA